ncbi:MAG: ECF transporter S component [Clostridia bacterium]|nr:ECF transporter S component [Clostridia bacterium]
MQTRTSVREKTRMLTTQAILIALVVVLQLICTFIKFGPFSITLALTPIVIGAAIFGWKSGALLGFVFSAVVYFTGLMGWDGGFVLMMMDYSAIGTTVLCLAKGTLAGIVAGLVFQPIAKKSKYGAALVASMAAPITNTGFFALGILTIFYGFLAQNAEAGQSPIALLFLGWIGVNFVVEFIVNTALSSVLTQIVDYFNKKMRWAK